MRLKFTLAATAALFVASCGSGDDAAEPAASEAMAQSTAASDPVADPSMPTDGQGFADMAAASDMYEIEAGKLAQEMGKAQEVKEFGAMMVEAHTKSTADLKTAASAESVTLAPKMTAKQEADLEALRTAGENFDATYKQQQVAAHEMALAMLRGFAESGPDGALKGFAAKTAPVVEGHLTEARTLP